MLFKLFILCVILFLLFKLLRIIIFRFLTDKIHVLCQESEFILGDTYFSIKKLQGKGKFGSIDVENLSLKINILSIFGLTQLPLFQLCCSRFHITILQEIEFTNSASAPASFEKWMVEKVAILFASVILRRASISISDIYVKYFDFIVSSKNIIVMYKLQKSDATSEVAIDDVCISYKEPLLRLVSLRLSCNLSTAILKYIIMTLFGSFDISVPLAMVDFTDNKLEFTLSPINISVPHDPLANCAIHIQPIVLEFPTINLLTSKMHVEIADIHANLLGGTLGAISIKREDKTIVEVPTLSFDQKVALIEHVSVSISIDIILDLLTLYRNFPLRDLDPTPKPVFVNYQIIVDSVNYEVNLSDAHQFIGDAGDINFMKSNLSVKHATMNLRFPDQTFQFAKVSKINVDLINTKSFVVGVRSGAIDISPFYALPQYFSEIAAIISYAVDLMKDEGVVQPPTPVLIKVNAHDFTIRVLKKQMVDTIQRANAAKLSALEGLRLRQNKALRAIESNPKNQLNEETFNQKSAEIFAALFRKVYHSIPQHDTFLTLIVKDISFDFDGPKIESESVAIEKIKSVIPQTVVNKEDISSLNAGVFKFDIGQILVSTDKFGKVAKIEGLSGDGWTVIAAPSLHNLKDIIYYDMSIDKRQLLIPEATTPTQIFAGFSAELQKVTAHLSTYIFELIDDLVIFMSEYQKVPSLYKKFDVIDMLRLQLHMTCDLKINQILVEVNKLSQPFDRDHVFEILLSDLQCSVHGKKIDAGIQEINLSVYHLGRFQRFLKIPKLIVALTLSSLNKSGDIKVPLFVPVDATKFLDPTYEPYLFYGTDLISLTADIDLSVTNQPAVLNIDFIQTIIDLLYLDAMHFKPVFFTESSMNATFSNASVKLKLPPIVVSLFNCKLSASASSKIFDLSYNEGLLKIESDDMAIDLYRFNENIGFSNIRKINIDVSEKVYIKIDEFSADISSSIIPELMNIKIRVPNAGRNNYSHIEIDPTIGSGQLNLMFPTESVVVEMNKIGLQIIFKTLQIPPRVEIEGFRFAQRNTSQFAESLLDISLNEVRVSTSFSPEYPLLKADNLAAKLLLLENHVIVFCQSTGNTMICLSPDIVNTILPEIKTVLPDIKSLENKDSESTVKNTRINCTVPGVISVHIINGSDEKIGTIKMENFSFDRVTTVDGGESDSFEIQNLEILDEGNTDDFHTAMSGASKDTLLKFKLKKERNMMKCPLFNLIDVGLNPFIIRVDMKFINNIIGLFPSWSDLNIFDLEGVAQEETEYTESSNTVVATSSDEAIGFYRLAHVSNFNAMISYRDLSSSFIKEVLDREFAFEGLDITDMFGSMEQLKERMKVEVRGKLIRAVLGMAIRKKK